MKRTQENQDNASGHDEETQPKKLKADAGAAADAAAAVDDEAQAAMLGEAEKALDAGSLPADAAAVCHAALEYLRADNDNDDQAFKNFIQSTDDFKEHVMQQAEVDGSTDLAMNLHDSCWKKHERTQQDKKQSS